MFIYLTNNMRVENSCDNYICSLIVVDSVKIF